MPVLVANFEAAVARVAPKPLDQIIDRFVRALDDLQECVPLKISSPVMPSSAFELPRRR